MKKPKIITVVGTRPEIIRLSRLIPLLDQVTDHKLVHTGQNYDKQLNQVFFDDLRLRTPDYFLDADTQSLGTVMGDILKKIESVFAKEQPDGVVILGDTNSAICAVLAKRMHIPVYHLEAGNRSFDENVPEESNRRMVDHVSDFNLPYNSWSYANLISEGMHPRRMIKTGSPMREILDYYAVDIKKSNILEHLHLQNRGYFLVSAHRQENVDSPARLAVLLESLNAIYEQWGLPVLISTHPRTRKRLEKIEGYDKNPGLIFHEPFGFFDYVALQMNAKVVISDSGTISEESAILNFPAITIRDSIERQEALEKGSIILTGLDKDQIKNALSMLMNIEQSKAEGLPEGYEVQDFSMRVSKFILSTVNRHHEWAGIRKLQNLLNN